MHVKPLPPDDLSCPPPPDADPRPEVRLKHAHRDDLLKAQELLALSREMTHVAHLLAAPQYDPFPTAYRLGLQARLMDCRLVLTGVIGSLTSPE